MRKTFSILGWVSVVWTVGRWLLNEIGYVQTAYDIATRMPPAIDWIINILFWPLTGPIVAIACAVALWFLGRGNAPHTIADTTTQSEPAKRQYSIEELKGIKGVLQEKVAAGTQLSLHASRQCDVYTPSISSLDLVNLSVDVSPDTRFLVTCNVYKPYRHKGNAWLGLKLNDICVNRVDGEHVIEDDTSVHIRWLIGSVNEQQIRQVVMEYPRESIHGQFGAEGKAAENIKKISVYGRTDDGVMALRNIYVYV